MSKTPSSIYAESRVALLTQHGKEGVIASAPSPATFRAQACSLQSNLSVIDRRLLLN